MWRWVLGFAFATSCTTAAANASDFAAIKHVIVTNERLAELVATGYEHSDTLRTLVQQIEDSGWTVFVQSGNCPMKEAVGCLLHHVGSYEGRPYLRLRIDPRQRHDYRVLSTVGHELQHALEVITSGEVRDTPGFIALFERIGSSSVKVSGGVMFETKAARHTEAQVVREMKRSSSR